MLCLSVCLCRMDSPGLERSLRDGEGGAAPEHREGRGLPIFLSNAVPPSPSGGHDKPSPSAWTSPVVPLGQHVTLQCHSHLGFDRFRLCKDAGGHVPNLQDVRFQNSLLVGPVTSAHAGTYRCLGYYSRSPSARSALSDPLTNVVTGVYRKPSLIAQPGPLVQSGRNGTLQCRSEITFDSFILILHREGGTTDPLHFVRQLHDGGSQANFSVGTMTSVCAGTYRCLCSLSHSHYEWSAPSDPLDMAITGENV
nr:killer cell immunoglobulin-like receptor 3DL3 [Vicugna pacos]